MNDNTNRLLQQRDDLPVKIGDLLHAIDHQQVARRAYEIYESRHHADGHADQDWFQAVSEYEARRESQPPTPFGPGASSSYADRTRFARGLRATNRTSLR